MLFSVFYFIIAKVKEMSRDFDLLCACGWARDFTRDFWGFSIGGRGAVCKNFFNYFFKCSFIYLTVNAHYVIIEA